MAMVVRANRVNNGIGGHISSFSSAATIYEVAFNHFMRKGYELNGGDMVFFKVMHLQVFMQEQFLEGRISEKHLANFRQELSEDGGLSSYPHPWLMQDFWQFATVSMGLGPIIAIYQARFMIT